MMPRLTIVLLLAASALLSSCREEDTLETPKVDAATPASTLRTTRGATDDGLQGVIPVTPTPTPGPVGSSTSTDDSGGATASVYEAVSVVSSVVDAASLSVRRTNGETWAFQLAGGISASAGDLVIYVGTSEAFGSPRGRILDAERKPYSILSSARLR